MNFKVALYLIYFLILYIRLQMLQQGQKKDENVLKISQKLFQTQWEGKESEYKNLIKQLEKKVKQKRERRREREREERERRRERE